MTINLLELFGGIGAGSKALKQVYEDVHVVDYVELDKYAVQSYNALNNTSYEPKDITKYHPNKNARVDILVHGSPCQDFSVMGAQAGGVKGSGTRSSLLYETIRILDELDTKPKYIVWENVKNLISNRHFEVFTSYIDTLKERGYNSFFKVLNACDYGLPQNRERVFVVSVLGDETFGFPQPIPLTTCAANLLTPVEFDKKNVIYRQDDLGAYDEVSQTSLDILPLTVSIVADETPRDYLQRVAMMAGKKYEHRYISTRRVYWAYGLCPTLTCSRGGGTEPKFLIKCNTSPIWRIKKLNAREFWQFMGFNDDEATLVSSIGISETQMKKQAGNSICVPVLAVLFKQMEF